jgi:hypothetical protein
MKLPIQETPTYNVELPLSKQKVSYRPFLVKEQRNLVMARDGKNAQEIFDSIASLMEAVTDGKIDALKLPTSDLEFLFLQVRSKSVGETSKLLRQCVVPDCGGTAKGIVNLSEITVDGNKFAEAGNKVEISDNLMVEFRYPNSYDAVQPMIMSCMVRIYDEENIYELSEHPDSEIEKFVESLTMAQFEKIGEFFADIPALHKTVEYICEKCGDKSSIEVRGLNNFF